jgi:fatty acid desaturase
MHVYSELQTNPTANIAAAIRSHKELIAFLRAFATPSDGFGLYRICKGWAIIIFVWCANGVLTTPDTGLSTVIYAVSVVAIGIGLKGLESCTHEAAHYTLFRTRPLNNSLEFLFALPVLEPVDIYRSHHLIHHAALGKTNDPAVQLYIETGVMNFPNGFVFAMLIRPLLGFHTLLMIKETVTASREHPKAALKTMAFWLPIVVLAYATGMLWPFIWYALVPLFFVLPILLFWGEVLDHVGLEWTAPIAASRNNLGRLIGFLVHPNHEGLHQIHHLHPGIPSHRLAEAYGELTASPWFRSSCVTCFGVLDSIKAIRRGRR